MPSRHEKGWDRIYHHYRPNSLPWELGTPRKVLVELVESGRIKPCKVLDLCCGAGTNPIFLAKTGFNVTALDVSDRAVEYARKKAGEAKAGVNFVVADFLNLPFKGTGFKFAFDFGCFHHVESDDRTTFIEEVNRVLKPEATYFMVCFSHKNGPAWNHFTKEQIVELFKDYFNIEWTRHVSSVEGDNVRRYFYEVLMEKPRWNA